MMDPRGSRKRRLALTGLLLVASACAVLATPAVPAAGAVPVGGRVLGPAGQGMAGATVELLPEPQRAPSGPATEPVARAVTGADGGFQLSTPGPGLFRVRVTAAGSPAMEHPLHPLLYETRLAPLILDPRTEGKGAARSGWRPAAAEPGPAAVPETLRLSGRAVDAVTGAPVAGALVWSAADPGAAARTGADGAFVVELPAGAPRLVHLAAPGYLAVAREVLPGADGLGMVALEPGAMVAGRVVDRSGRPVADVAVRLAAAPGTGPGLETHTRPDGGFLIGGVPTARSLDLRATVAAAGHRLAALRGLAPLRPGEARGGLRLVLSPWPAVVGRVVDPAGRPLDGARLRLLPEPAGGAPEVTRISSPGAEARSRSDGRFELVDAGPGPFRLEVERAGFVPLVLARVELVSVRDPAPSTPADIELGDLRLATGAELTGRVLDEREQPVTGARVEARPAAGGEPRRPRRTASGDDGAFALAELPPGELLEVSVRHPDFAPALLPDVEVSPEPLEIVLRAGATISGRVVDGTGRGVGEAVVLATADAGPAGADAADPADTETEAGEQQTTEPDGRFTIRGLPAGTVSLRATAPGFREARLVGLEIAPDAPLEGLELALEEAAVLAGTVRDADGAPLPGARVSLARGEAADGPFAAAVADDAGAFRLEGLEPGPARAEAEHPGHRRAARSLDLAPGENRADLVLEQGLAVAGRVVDDAGAPVAGVEVAVEAAPGARGDRSTTSGADGSFRLAGLEPGTLALTAHGDGFEPARVELELGAEPIEGLEVLLARGGAVAGRLLGLAAAELERVEVAAFAPDRGTRAGMVEPGGLYRIEGLTTGDWTVAAGAGARQARGRVRLDGGEAALDLDFGSGLRLAGRVRVGGRPLAGAEVTLAGRTGQGVATTSTGAAGEFELTGLAAGAYRLRVAEPRGGFAHEQAVELDADRELALDLAADHVAGEVQAADGSGPVPGAVVRLEPLAGGAGGTRSVPSVGATAAALTDSTGFFLLSEVPEGEYRLTVRKPGFADLEQRLVVAAGAGTDLRLLLPPAGP